MAKAKSTRTTTASKTTVTKASTRLTDSAKAAEPDGTPAPLATPEQETAMREAATKPAAVKEAAKTGKKDPIAKFGDPDADPVEMTARRAVFG
jgi:hypothetical protein